MNADMKLRIKPISNMHKAMVKIIANMQGKRKNSQDREERNTNIYNKYGIEEY